MILQERDFLRLTGYIKQNYGINLESKRHLIEGRLTNLILEKGYRDFGEYFDFVITEHSQKETEILLNKLTTNHTYFMREEAHFHFFKENVLPWLEEHVKDKDLRIWSAGCSSGQEPYTLAMIINEYFANRGKLWDKKLLATDICVEVLEKAVQGIYDESEVSKIESGLRNKYLQKIGKNTYEMKDTLKKEIIFRIFNLMDTFPFQKKFHVIFCRNVMIYFDQPTKNRLIQKFYDMTIPGGYLFIGMSESIRKEESPYKYVMPSVYRKV